MLTDDIIKNRFILEVLTKARARIHATMLNRLHDTPALLRHRFDIPGITAALQSQTRNITTTPDGVIITEQIDKRIRYLDIRHLGNLRIYNKILYPTLYRNAFARIHYGFTEEIRRRIRESLTDAYKPLNNP